MSLVIEDKTRILAAIYIISVSVTLVYPAAVFPASANMYSDKNCSRVIGTSKYERNAPEIRNWWYQLFDMLEADAAIPPEKRVEVLKEVFPERLLDRILSIVSVDGGRLRERDSDSSIQSKTVSVSQSSSQASSKSSSKSSERSDASRKPCKEKFNLYGKLRVKPQSLGLSSGDKHRVEVGPNNPYLKFFLQRPDRATIWHTLPPLSLEEMNLTQKAEAITEAIATNFVEWMRSIASEDESPTTLTVAVVKKMFSIGFNTHAAKSLCVKMKEMASVPEAVAKLLNVPEMSKRSQLHRQIRRDVIASQKKRDLFAFGTKLPKELQVYAPHTEQINKWLVCERVPKDLQSMATVFQGITHLRSTRAFCEYLLENPEVPPPQYLLDNNMLDTTYLRERLFSMESPYMEKSVMPAEVEGEMNVTLPT